jgi:Protein of unknown function (DUF3710)
MSLFRKKAAVPEEQALLAAMDDLRERPKAEPGTEDARDLSDAADDTADADSADSDGVTRLDFGAVRVPAVDGMQVRAEIDDDEQVVAVSVMLDDTVLQLQAFAAPKSENLWDEVRQEIAEGIRGNQGKAREADGPFGRELQAEVVVTDESGKTLRQPARFIGIDGPRWFLRGVITGAGANEQPKAEAVEQVFAGVQVERGDHAAAPRAPLPLSLPDDPSLTPQ